MMLSQFPHSPKQVWLEMAETKSLALTHLVGVAFWLPRH